MASILKSINQCPTCQSISDEQSSNLPFISQYPLKAYHTKETDLLELNCVICGKYGMTLSFYNEQYCKILIGMSNVQRAALSHYIISSNLNEKVPIFTQENFNSIISQTYLPSPATQVINLIRYIGDKQNIFGHSITDLPINFFSIIGAPNFEIALELIPQMKDRGLVSYQTLYDSDEKFISGINLGLTLKGWDLFESEKRGGVASNYGFVAYQFNNQEFPKVLDYVRPKILTNLGFDLIDMGIEKSVGTIDNIMRMRIRESAFVVADLTDDNHGAYWEAGFADGLEKPVIYVCEEKKFIEKGTHFDTNHQMTHMWNLGNLQLFCEKLEGTIKETLKMQF